MSAAESNQAVYRERLQTLQKIRARANGQLKLAQICVLGDQSSGKSSLLAACTGIAFPENAGICTRAPIVVECKCDMNMTDDEYEIQGPKGAYELCRDLEELKTRITNTQDRAIQRLQEQAPPPEQPADAPRGQTSVSMDEIRVKVCGPRQMDIIVVDLPGIIHNGAGAEETRQLIRTYCEPPQTLMLLVSEAKQDEESIEAIALAKKYDEHGSRTLRVLTKFDVFDSDKAKYRARSWVEAGRSDTLGPHAVVCRSHGSDHDANFEASRVHGLPAHHSGVEALKARLPALFADLISRSLPDLHNQVVEKLLETEGNLRAMGEEPMTKSEMVSKFQQAVDDTGMFEEVLTPCMDNFRDAVLETKEKVTKEWTDSKFKPNAFQPTHFQGSAAAKACMKEIAEVWWCEPRDQLFKQVCRCTEESMTLTPDVWSRKGLPKAFCRAVEAAWQAFCREDLSKRFRQQLEADLQKERTFGTMNHYLDSKFEELTVLPQDLLTKIAKELPAKIGEANMYQNTEAVATHYLQAVREAWVVQYQGLNLQDQQKYRIFNAVLAHWSVEFKTLVDNVLKTTRDCVIKAREEWLSRLPGEHKVLEMAVEGSETAEKRDALKKTVADMKGCLQELEHLREKVGSSS